MTSQLLTANLLAMSTNRAKRILPSEGGMTYTAILKAANLVKNHMEKTFAPFELTGQQYNVLRILRGAGPEGLPTLVIAERMIEKTPGITRMIDRLVAKGLVDREPSDADRRRVICRISKTGLRLLNKVDVPIEDNNDVFDGVTLKEMATIRELLNKIISDLERRGEDQK